MQYREIKPDVAQALGRSEGDAYCLRRVTEAQRLLSNKGLIDPLIGEIAICVCNGFVTLPREVHTVLGVQVDTEPAILRNEWYTYHINGSGDIGYTPYRFTDVLGSNFCTFRDPDRAVRLIANVRSAADVNKKLRVYGWDENGERIYSTGKNGNKEDGFLVPTMFGSHSWNSAVSPIKKIDRIAKDVTSDYIDLAAVDPTTNQIVSKLGSYRPDETAPTYTRIRVPEAEVVRVKFKRRDAEIRSDEDWINCDNAAAFILALRSVQARMDGKLSDAREYEMEAVRMIKEDMLAANHGGIAPPQVVVNELPWKKHGLFY